MRRINVNIFPRSGYFFKETDGTIIRAEVGWAGVIARVVAYRRRAGLPPGNPEVEVHEFACQQNPNACTEESPAQFQAKRAVSLKGRLLGWLSRIKRESVKTPITFSSSELAKQRADICAACPYNTAISDGCASCRAALLEMRRAVIGGRTIDKRLTGCLILSEDLPTAVWFEQQTVENGELPANCWRKRGV